MSDFILAYNIMIFIVIFTTIQASIILVIIHLKFKWNMEIVDLLFLLFSPTGGYRVYLIYKHRYCNRYDIPKDLSLSGIKKYIEKKNKEKELKSANKEYRNSIKILIEKSNRY